MPFYQVYKFYSIVGAVLHNIGGVLPIGNRHREFQAQCAYAN